jgi:biotin synthase
LLIANVGDFDVKTGRQLVNAGFTGIYHAARLGEGSVTRIPLERRLRTLRAARDAGLLIGTCLEPVGPEHATTELVEKLAITREAQPAFSGAARRINIPNTALAREGMVTEARMAHILAVVRVVMPLSVAGNCTHEPNVLGAFAGANLFWAEAGANPRDTNERTEEGRGATVARCRELFNEAQWACLDGASRFYTQLLAA